eukprot:Gb_18217 [translate_table: standard]
MFVENFVCPSILEFVLLEELRHELPSKFRNLVRSGNWMGSAELIYDSMLLSDLCIFPIRVDNTEGDKTRFIVEIDQVHALAEEHSQIKSLCQCDSNLLVSKDLRTDIKAIWPHSSFFTSWTVKMSMLFDTSYAFPTIVLNEQIQMKKQIDSLIDDCNAGSKDASDKMILVDMLFWALENAPPANILLISGDRDFANALHRLGMKNYNILLARPNHHVSPSLNIAANKTWLWPNLAKGENESPTTSPDIKQANSNSNLGATEDQKSFEIRNTISVSDPRHSSCELDSQSQPHMQQSNLSQYYIAPDNYQQIDQNINFDSWADESSLPMEEYTDLVSSFGNGLQIPQTNSQAFSVSGIHQLDPNNQTRLAHIQNGDLVSKSKDMKSFPSFQSLVSAYYSGQNIGDSQSALPASAGLNKASLYDTFTLPDTNSVRPSTFATSSGLNKASLHDTFTLPETNPFLTQLRSPSLWKSEASQAKQSPNFTIGNSSGISPDLISPNESTSSVRLTSNGIVPPLQKSYVSFETKHNPISQRSQLFDIPSNKRPSYSVLNASLNNSGQSDQCIKTGTSPKSDMPYLVGLRIILMVMETLKENKMMPTEANIQDCILHGLRMPNFNFREPLDKAVENKEIIALTIHGGLKIYVPHNTSNLWHCVDPLSMTDNYPAELWEQLFKFLQTWEGRTALISSQSQYDAAQTLKKQSLKTLALGEIIHMLQLAITIRRWIRPSPLGWNPLSITLSDHMWPTMDSWH